jgi:GNAT superfamily N-acetyltransferase
MQLNNNISAHLYKPEDRLAVRDISYGTADGGCSAENIFQDREALADFLTLYYTDYEPRSLWVAEYEGKAVGYLSGCLDSRRYTRVMAWQVLPYVIIIAVLRGALWRWQTWKLLKAVGWMFCRGQFIRHISFDKYPAHLHVNVREGFRGKKVGKYLVERFISQVKAAGLKGIHLSVHEDNIPAHKFFEHLGFVELSRYPTINTSSEHNRIAHAVIYVMDLRNGNPL